MKESKPIYGFYDQEDFTGVVWETEKGMIVTIKGNINPNNNLFIKSCETGEDIKDIDMRNMLMDILVF
ncbi:MAG TPA: hypothetical protein GXZ90_06045 [Clostridiales bacterium]|nr:hypothetical protein [Clostridiales bacterium]